MMIQEPFAAGNSWIHRVDPRFKVGIATAYSFVVALSYEFATLTTAVLVSILLLSLARLNYLAVIKRISTALVFLIFLWVLLPLTYPGDPLFHLGPMAATRSGITLAAQISLKSTAILLGLTALIATMNTAALGHALACMHIPEKLVYLLLITYRYLFLIEQEFQDLLRAAKIRGFRPGTNLHTYRTLAFIVGMVFVRASARAERVHQAMLCRGFNGRFHSLGDFQPSLWNRIFLIAMTVVVIGILLLERLSMVW